MRAPRWLRSHHFVNIVSRAKTRMSLCHVPPPPPPPSSFSTDENSTRGTTNDRPKDGLESDESIIQRYPPEHGLSSLLLNRPWRWSELITPRMGGREGGELTFPTSKIYYNTEEATNPPSSSSSVIVIFTSLNTRFKDNTWSEGKVAKSNLCWNPNGSADLLGSLK